jgi:sugar/nucleoside kinase (ribokinase family)
VNAESRLDLTCFSYLAAVTTLHVSTYPAADYGVGVERVERFLAGDGPIVAGAASALGLTAALIGNTTADDDPGRYVTSVLDHWGVVVPSERSEPVVRRETPFSTVVSSRTGSRAWFAYLPDVVTELEQVDLTPLAVSRMAYVDCYELFGEVSHRPVTFALEHGVPVVANLGGSPPPDWLVRGHARGKLLVLQTSVPEDVSATASSVAAGLAELSVAEHVVVTRGRHGAVIVDGGMEHDVPTRSVPVKAVQGAGSVFSATLAGRFLAGETFQRAVGSACAAATDWCATGDFPNSRSRMSAE